MKATRTFRSNGESKAPAEEQAPKEVELEEYKIEE